MSFFNFENSRPILSVLFILVGILWPAIPAPAQKHTIKLATLAPEGSNWVKAMRAIEDEVVQKTNGEVRFKIYAGGVQGDEDVMLRKIRTGQLHAGGFGAQGLSRIFADVLALEMPFLFKNYEEIDYVLEQMDAFYQEGYEKNGFVLLGWVDIGFIHILSQQPIHGAEDIKGLKVWRLEGEPITEVLFRKAGVASVPLIIPDVLMGLQTNLVEVVYASPTAAIVLQWFTRVNYLTELPINYTLGALLIDKQIFYRLSPEQQDILLQAARTHMHQQTLQNRKENQEAVKVMQDQGLELVTPPTSEIQSFKDLVQESIPELVGTAFSQESFALIQKHLADFRTQSTSDEP